MADIKKEYDKKYSGIPTEQEERFNYLTSLLRISEKGKELLANEVKRITKIKWKTVNFTIYVIPKGTPRPRSGRGNHFYVKGASDNKKFFREFYKTIDSQEKIVTPCKIRMDSYLPLSSSMKKVEMLLAEIGLIRPISKPDFDNLIKTYTDMIQGTMLLDDSLVIEGISRKFYSSKPRVEISISYMEEFDSVFNKNKVEKWKGSVSK